MAQFNAGTEYTSTPPGNQVTATNLVELVTEATATAGIILDQNTLSRPTAEADSVLVADNTLDDTHAPTKVTLGNLLPETVRNQSHNFAVATGTSTAYAITLAPAATAYTAGMVVRFQANNACGAAPTANVNGLGALAIVNANNAALSANDILSGQLVELVYQAGNNNWQMMAANIVSPPLLSDAARMGTSTYAVATGTASAYAVALTPATAALAAGMVVRFKANNTNAPSGGHTTLNVDGHGAANIYSPAGTDIPGGTILNGQLVELVFDGTNWYMVTGQSVRFTSAAVALPTAGSTITPIAHGLGSRPNELKAFLLCITNDSATGYAAGQIITIASAFESVSNFNVPAFAVYADATNIYCAFSSTGGMLLPNANTGYYAAVSSNTHFQLLFTANL